MKTICITLALLLLAGCDLPTEGDAQRRKASQALWETMADCKGGRITWQASRTNEPGVVWFSMRCEVQP